MRPNTTNTTLNPNGSLALGAGALGAGALGAGASLNVPGEDDVCGTACLAGAGGGAAFVALLGLSVYVYRRWRTEDTLPATEAKELEAINRFSGALPLQDVYSELSDMSSHEYSYEEPVPLYDMADPDSTRPPMAFHNPTYSGPEIPEVSEYANAQVHSTPINHEPVYDTIEEAAAPKVMVNTVYSEEEA